LRPVTALVGLDLILAAFRNEAGRNGTDSYAAIGKREGEAFH
jgi:hypothetical protein